MTVFVNLPLLSLHSLGIYVVVEAHLARRKSTKEAMSILEKRALTDPAIKVFKKLFTKLENECS